MTIEHSEGLIIGREGRRKLATAIAGCAMLGVMTLVSGCRATPKDTLVNACVQAVSPDASVSDRFAVEQQCGCAADAAHEYLDADDYIRLVGVASIYNAPDPYDVKLHRLISALVKSGVSARQAAVTAMDLLFVAHKIDQECRH